MAQLNGIVRGNANDVATNETISPDTIYSLQDLQGISITNAQMTNALTKAQDGFFKRDEIRYCTDSGTYSQGHFYKFTITGTSPVDNVASWTDLGTLGGGAGKTLITLTGESGTLTDTQIAKVLDNSAVVEFKIGSNIYKYAENQGTFVTYTSVVYPTTSTQEIRALYIQIDDDAVNYKTWSLEVISPSNNIIDIGAGQTTIEGTVYPTISKTDADEIYLKYVSGQPITLLWGTTGIATHISVIYASDISGYEIDCIIHGKVAQYSWTDSTTGNITPTIV